MRKYVLALALCLAPLPPAAGSNGVNPKDVPSWVRELSSRTLPSYPGKVPAAVLMNEQHVTVDSSGRMVIQTRHAVKILTDEGRKQATAAAWYYAGDKPPRLRAWLIGPSGFVKAYTNRSFLRIWSRSRPAAIPFADWGAISPACRGWFAREFS